MKILFAASEITPLAKVGGLGDVIASLPQELKRLGQDVRIVIPYYQVIKKSNFKTKLIVKNFPVKLNPLREKINLYQGEFSSKLIIYLLENKRFISQGGIYFAKSAFCDSLGEIQRFIFFSQSVLEIFPFLGWQPEIIHCHDWHTATIPLLVKVKNKKIKTLLTIHNLANQGVWQAKKILTFLGLKENDWFSLKEQPEGPYGKDINLLQQGILNADLINTVSPTYAREILTKEFGQGLEKVLRKRKKDLFGILNGIDETYFNPQTDDKIKVNYSWRNLEKKEKNKIDLQKTVGLHQDSNVFLMSFIGRLTSQKGIDLIYSALDEIIKKKKVQLVILGKGSQKYEKMVKEMAFKYPCCVSAQIKFDTVLARKIYAGSDLLLMPSRFEPCGLCQLIAFRYGTIPLVRATGGLKDTVIEGKSGFVFKNYSFQAFLFAFRRAFNFYQKRDLWRQMQIRVMKSDYSWRKSAKKYIQLYQKLLN